MEATKTVTKTNKMPADKKTVKKVETPVKAVAEKAPKKTVVAKAEVVVPVVEATPVAVETRTASVILAGLQDTLKAINSDFNSRVRAVVQEAQAAVKAIKRDAREGKRRRRKDPADMTAEEKSAWEARRANNAFLKLRPISDELCTFMGLPAKSQKSQTDVTKFISNYVKTHSCFDPTFKRRIIPDTKLGKLLRVKDGQEVTYLNLQSFLKVHFLKPSTA